MIGRWTHRGGLWRYLLRRRRQRLVAIAYRVRHGWMIWLEDELAGPDHQEITGRDARRNRNLPPLWAEAELSMQ
jgi:hypothetical protein